MRYRLLISTETSRLLDSKTQTAWGFNPFAMVEAAGRGCAQVFTRAFPRLFSSRHPRIVAVAGNGNNGADAMIMLRYWLLSGRADPSRSAVLMSRFPKQDVKTPLSEVFLFFKKMKVPVMIWDGDAGEGFGRASEDLLANADIIIDGIAGTGVKGPLTGAPEEMVKAINALKGEGRESRSVKKARYHCPMVVSVDIPSGNSDSWKPDMPVINADVTLVIEPQKYCLYTPAARPHCGMILPVGGLFPPGLVASCQGAELLDWNSDRQAIWKVKPDTYKNSRGTVEIRAGAIGSTGAALIAARGAQAAGAGLIRLISDESVYPVLASRAGGIMVIPTGRVDGEDKTNGRFKPDAILLGPGWGKTPDRTLVLKKALKQEKEGIPLILDADAITLAGKAVFSGRTILTPHPGELASYTGIAKEELLARPGSILLDLAREKKAVILFKSHVMTIASFDGRLGVVDGMTPVLSTGGSGDLLAGFCAAIGARMMQDGQGFDGYTCAAAAAALLIASGRSEELAGRFLDPLEIADKAAGLAGEAWLAQDIGGSVNG
ncbi:MAG: bifunctional ADP-dependent NAD(P)H-hydrate dehydratase/NAD(P)H-hydrate epimerase [Treponema sp.]|jgi:NAD(P)H-hydrate epimerase|nr:bifunctional ADP-dependent NAD(P)H-hydrate dehydratase/NAD(P)H-hydrate epimerase [Treponema sp.]